MSAPVDRLDLLNPIDLRVFRLDSNKWFEDCKAELQAFNVIAEYS